MFENEDIKMIVAVGHDGSVNTVFNPDRENNIEECWETLYNSNIEKDGNKQLAINNSIDDLYKMGIFDYESRWFDWKKKVK